RVVAAGAVAGELGDRHHLHGVDAQRLEVPEPAGHVAEGGRPVVVGVRVVERADVQLVDDQLIPGGYAALVALPVEVRVVDDAVADRVGDLPGVRVDPGELAERGDEVEPVLPAVLRSGTG